MILLHEQFSAEQNQRACDLVINGIAHYPQSWANQVIIADALLQEFAEVPDYRQTGIGVRELASIDPDGQECANRINDIHTRFGIAYRVSPGQAIDHMFSGAGFALDCIREEVIQKGSDMGIQIPDDFSGFPVRRRLPMGDPSGRSWVLSLNFATDLYTVLRDHPDLTAAVSTSIAERAEEIRQQSRDRQQYAAHTIQAEKVRKRAVANGEVPTPVPREAMSVQLRRLGRAIGSLLDL